MQPPTTTINEDECRRSTHTFRARRTFVARAAAGVVSLLAAHAGAQEPPSPLSPPTGGARRVLADSSRVFRADGPQTRSVRLLGRPASSSLRRKRPFTRPTQSSRARIYSCTPPRRHTALAVSSSATVRGPASSSPTRKGTSSAHALPLPPRASTWAWRECASSTRRAAT